MIREIERDTFFLSQRSADASPADAQTADDLADTLRAHRESCVGMAANMIGVLKRIIVFQDGGQITEMFNPVILRASEPYEAQEGCLSLDGTRKTRRFGRIKVQWQTRDGLTRLKTYTGFPAQIIQHEIDHCAGILI